MSVFDSTIVSVEMVNGLCGWGELCTLGSSYLPSYSEGARCGIQKLAPALLGKDALQINELNRVMDFELQGHPYVKSALDMALWDLLGKASGLPACTLLGGRFEEPINLYRALSMASPAEMAENLKRFSEEGYVAFQLKLGEPGHHGLKNDIERIKLCSKAAAGLDVICDANTGWKMHKAVRLVQAVSDLELYIEQPCKTYEECLSVRQHCSHPFILDEVICDTRSITRADQDSACDAVNIKISKFGGLTKAKQARDLCVELGLAMIIEDTWGGDISTAAIMHLTQSTPPEFRLVSTDFSSYNAVSNALGSPQRNADGKIRVSEAPGLGVEPRMDVLRLLQEHAK